MLALNQERVASTAPPFLAARGITKSYGGAQALKGVSITIQAG